MILPTASSIQAAPLVMKKQFYSPDFGLNSRLNFSFLDQYKSLQKEYLKSIIDCKSTNEKKLKLSIQNQMLKQNTTDKKIGGLRLFSLDFVEQTFSYTSEEKATTKKVFDFQ